MRRVWLLLLLLLLTGETHHSNSSDNPPLVSTPVRQPNGSWRVAWSSIEGHTYLLQRAANDVLGGTNWVDLAVVIGTGTTTYYDDATSARQRFYRVRAEANPDFRFLAPPQRQVSGAWRLSWSSQPGHTYVLQRATNDALGANDWTDITTVFAVNAVTSFDDISSSTRRFYRVRLADTVAAPVAIGDADRFVSLGTNGLPVEGSGLTSFANGLLAAFEFRPGGRSGLGMGEGFFLRFPNGARIITNGSARQIEFTNVVGGFSSNFPVQLTTALTWSGTTPRSVPSAGLDYDLLCQTFDRNPTNGIDLVLFGQTPITWLAGVLEDDGIRGGRFGFKALASLPLPGSSGAYPDFTIDLTRKEGVRIPFAGSFALPDGTSFPARLTIPPQRPLWLTIKPSGQLALEGRADLQFTNGPSFSVDFGFDDPFYHLKMVASGIHVPALGSLSALLPNNPSNCIPAAATSNQLNQAAACLRSFDRAYLNFSAAAVGAASTSNQVAAPTAPPDPVTLGVSVLQAWTASATANQSLPLASLKDLLAQSGDAAVGARDLRTICDYYGTLLQVKLARATNGFQADVTADAELNDALAKIVSAAVARADQPDAILNLKNMTDTAHCLLEAQALLQKLGSPLDQPLQAALTRLVSRFTQSYVASLGVTNGVFTPPAGSMIAALNRFVALETLRDLVGLRADAQLLGIDSLITAPVDEAMSQLALRLWSVLEAQLNATETAHDYPGFAYALEDTLDLVALEQSGIFPNHPALAGLPGPSALNGFAARLGNVFTADSTRTAGDRSLGNQAAEIRRLLRILHDLPSGVTYASPPFQRAYDRLETTLASSVAVLAAQTSQPALVDLFEAGILQAQLRDQFTLAAPVVWESQRLPLLVSRLIAVAGANHGWSQLHQAAELALAEAERRSTLGDQPRRLLYLQTTAQLLQAAHEVSVALWAEEGARRAANPGLYLADLLLPGDIFVDKISGAVSYDRSRQLITGAFGGQLRLPKFGLSLTVANASFGPGGAFDLNTYGTINVPLTNPQGALSIPERRPLHIAYAPPDRLTIAGGAKLALNNGLSVEAYASLADPQYVFGFMAEGICFDLGDKLRGYLPVLSNAPAFAPAAARDLNDYFRSLSATLDRFSGLTQPPLVRGPGEPPDFSSPATALPTDGLEAWANSELADARLGLSRNYSNTQASVAAELRRLQEEYRSRQASNDVSRLLLQLDLIRKLCRAFEQKSSKPGEDPTRDLQPEMTEVLRNMETNVVLKLLQPGPALPLTEENELFLLTSEIMFVGANPCFAYGGGFDTNRLKQALAVYHDATIATRFAELGLQLADGTPLSPPDVLHALPHEYLLAGLTNLVARWNIDAVNQRATVPTNHQDVNSFYIRANSTLALQAREQAMAGLVSRSVTNENDYAEIRLRYLQLSELYLHQQVGAFDYGTNLLLNLDGSRTVYDAGREQDNTTTRFEGAFLYAAEHPHRIFVPVIYFTNSDLRLPVNTRVTNLEKIMGLDRPLAQYNIECRTLGKDPGLLYRPPVTNVNVAVAYSNYVFQVRRQPVLTAPAAEAVRREMVQGRLAQLQDLVGQPVGAGTLEKGRTALIEFIVLGTFMEGQAFDSELAQMALDVRSLTAKYRAVAEAQRGWWYLNQYTTLLLDAAEAPVLTVGGALRTSLAAAADETVRSAANIADTLKQLLPLQRPFELALPGNLEVRRVGGEVRYNRQTGALSGSFLGRLEFPDLQNAFFEISQATLDRDLNFSIAAATAGPLPFTGVRATASVLASNGPNHSLVFTGNGSLAVTNGPSLAVTLGFNTDTRELSFASQAGNLASLRFTDNLVLYDAGFGFTVRNNAQSGELRANGSAGFFAKGPLPATNAPLSRTNFHLFATNVQVALNYSPGRVDLAISNGTFFLPSFFYPTNLATLCPGLGSATGPSIQLNPDNPITATFLDQMPPSVSFNGELDFRQFAFEAPELPGLAAAVCSAQLKFSSTNLPYLTNVTAALQIPIPKQTNYVDLTNGVFTLTGFPSGRIQLRDDLTLLDLNGFRFTLLGQTNPACGHASGLTVYPSDGFTQLPSLRLDGGLRIVAPVAMLTGATNDNASGLACGSLAITNGQLPWLEVQTLQFGGTFHLGQGGPVISNALISFTGLENLFRLDAGHPFAVQVNGALQIPSGPQFIMQNARFTFSDPLQLPRFSVTSLGLNNENFTLLNALPAKVTKAQLTLRNPNAELPWALAPTNVSFLISSEIRLPPGANPVLLGAVDNLVVEFDPNGVPRVKGIDGFDMAVGGLKLPPIKELGGRLRVGGLSSGNLQDIYLVGRLGGSYQGYTLVGQFAANYTGPLGFCLDVNAGAAGIPIGPTGILFTGASGGESLVNNNGDPCDFKTYFTKDASGNLMGPSGPTPPTVGMTWENFRTVVERVEAQAQVFANNVPGLANPGLQRLQARNSTANLPCPGDCPPPTVNIFCQPHPDQTNYPGKIIAKFSAIDEATLNNKLRITPELIASLGNSFTVLASGVAHAVRTNIAAQTPLPDASLLGPAAAAALGGVITNALDELEASFSNLCYVALDSNQAGENNYSVIRRLAYAGLPCPDVTMSVSGNLSYTGISSFAYVSGKGVLSTAGAGGVIGTVYVVGVPLGEARVFIAVTDAQGNPNPSICGTAKVAFGPLELGELRIAEACPGCVTGFLSGLPQILAALSDTVLNRLATQVMPELAAQNPGRAQLIAAFLALPTTQQVALFAHLANQPLSALPPNLPQVFFQGISNVYSSLNPVFVGCGDVTPKIFGLPLGSSVVGARFYATKSEEAGAVDFSPSWLLGYFLPVLPGSDTASLSFALAYGDQYELLFGGLAGGFSPENAPGYIQSAIDYSLQNTTFGIAYELHPFGFSMGAAAARVILPNLTTHPVLPWSTWVRPEDRGLTNLPSRHELALAALDARVLGDAVNWRGTTNDFSTIYPTGSPQRTALTGLSLAKDYFPHGGVVGAAKLTLPAVLTDQPPLDKINVVLNAQANPLDRLVTAMDLIQNYFLRFNTNGALAFYIPAPNPPVLYDASGGLLGQAQLQSLTSALHPQDLLNSINSFDVTNLRRGSFYPTEQGFIRGYLDGQLLGVPINRSDIVGLPADANRSEGFLSITSSIPNGSWLKQFVTQASLIFDIRGVPPAPIETRFTKLLAQMQAAKDTNANATVLMQLADDAITALTGDMPKARLTADFAANNLLMPAPITDLVAFSGSAQLHAFSVRYNPTFDPTNNGPLARVQREGGIALQGALNLRANGSTLADIPNAELSVVPNGANLPALAGQFQLVSLTLPGAQLNDVRLDFASAPEPHFSGSGSIAGLAVGLFGIQPLASGALTGQVAVARTGPNAASVALAVAAAQISLPSIYGDRILIHGTERNDPFTFSTTGPWHATVELTNGITVGAAGVNLVRLGAGGLLDPIAFRGNGTSTGAFTVGFGPAVSLTLFPGQAAERTVTLAAGGTGSLTVSSDGTFGLNATIGGAGLSFDGIAVPASASLAVSNNGVAFTWTINGGTTATLSLAPDGTVSFNGTADLPPLNFGVFQLTGTNGGNLQGSFNHDGFAVTAGAKLTLLADWLQNQSVTLSAFTFSNSGAFSLVITNPGNSLSFGGYPFDLTGFSLNRTPTNQGGVTSLSLSGSLHAAPNFPGWPAVPFNGSISSAGAVNLAATTTNVNLFGFAVRGLTNRLTLATGQFAGQFTSEFQLGNGTGLWSPLGSNWFSGTLNVDGSGQFQTVSPGVTFAGFGFSNSVFSFTKASASALPEVRLEGDLSLNGFPTMRLAGSFSPLGGVAITPLPPTVVPFPYPALDAQLSLVLNNTGFNVTGQLHQPPLPAFTLSGFISNSGAYHLTGLGGGVVDGYNFSAVSATLDRLAGGGASLTATGTLAVPNLGSYLVSGAFTNGGGYALSASIPLGLNLTGLPIGSIGTSGGATLFWTSTGVKISGMLAGGVLATVTPIATISGEVAYAPGTGSRTLSASAVIQSLTNGQFRVRPAAGINFTNTLDNAGLHLAAGALFEYGSYFAAGLPLPEITIGADGSFSAVTGNPDPVNLSLRGFGINNAAFTLQRAANGTLTVPNFAGALNVPVLNTLVDLSGALTNNGGFALTGSVGNSLSLSGLGLPVTSLGANAGVTLNNSSLTLTGALTGAIFNSLPGATVGGTLTITAPPSATISLGGIVSVPSLSLGAFTLHRSDNGPIQATWNGSGIVFPASENLQLEYRGLRLGTFALPTFTNDANGNFSFSVSNASFTLNNFSLSGANFTFSRAGGVTALAVSSATLTVPGFNQTVTSSNSGALASDGTFSLTGNVAGNFTPWLANSFGALSGNSSVTLNHTALHVIGSVSGGALGWLIPANPGFAVTADLTILNTGQITPAASFVLPELLLTDKVNGFHLARAGGGNFTVSLNGTGAVLPSGAQLFYRNTLLGNFTLGSFNIASDGSFSVNSGAVNLALDGFNLTGASFVLSRSGGVTRLALAGGASLALPGFGASVSVTGAATNDGTFRFAGTTTGALPLSGVPVASMNLGATAVLARAGGVTTLTLNGGVAGGVLNSGVSLISAVGSVSVAASGALTISGSVTAQPLNAGVFVIERQGTINGNITATWSNSGLSLSAIRLRTTTGIFDNNFNLPDLTLPFSGAVSFAVAPPNLKLLGYSLTGVSLTLNRNAAGVLTIDPITATLGLPNGFPAKTLTGNIAGNGSVVMNFSGSLTLGEFTAASGNLYLRNSGMTADGSFLLRGANTDFGTVTFSGGIYLDGTYSLTGSGGLTINGFPLTGNINFTLSPSGVVPQAGWTPTLRFGTAQKYLAVPLSNFSLNSSGISFSATKVATDGWSRFLDAPNGLFPNAVELGDVYGILTGTVTLALNNANGSFGSSLNGTFGWWIVSQDCNVPVGSRCTPNFAPDIADPNLTQKLSVSGNISSDGTFSVNENHGGQNGFNFHLW